MNIKKEPGISDFYLSLLDDPIVRDRRLRMFRQVRISDLTPTDPNAGPPDLSSCDPDIRFPIIFCRGTDVVLAFSPYDEYENLSEKMPGLRLTRSGETYDDIVLSAQRALEALAKDDEQPALFRYEWLPAPEAALPALASMGMISWKALRSGNYLPNIFGNKNGLALHAFRDADGKAHNVIGCTRNAWNALRQMRNDPPDWEQLPLAVRLENMRAGRPSNPGHYKAALLRLVDMPLEVFTDGLHDDDVAFLKEHLGDLSITYGQAAQRIQEMLYTDAQKELAQQLLERLAIQFSASYQIKQRITKQNNRKGGLWGWNYNT